MKSLYFLILIGLFSISSFAQTQLGSDIDGEAPGDHSGQAVSLSNYGTVLAIGAHKNDGNGDGAGHVRVYQYKSGAWFQLGNDIDGDSSGAIGRAVSLSDDGTFLALGTSNNHVRVYKYHFGMWSQLGSDVNGEADDRIGNSVSLSDDGTVLAIGVVSIDDNLGYTGKVRVYEYNAETWSQLGSDIVGESARGNGDESISLSNNGRVLAIGTDLAIGEVSSDGTLGYTGKVRVYEYSSETWFQLGTDIVGESDGDESGRSVSLSDDGTVLAIGAPKNEGNGFSSGHVRVYQYNLGAWSQLGSDIDGETGSQSGNSVSLSDDGTVIAIGAYKNNGRGSRVGQVRVYHYVSGVWSQQGGDIAGEASGDQSGNSISLSDDGTILAIGAHRNDGNGLESGHVRVFDIGSLVDIDDVSNDNLLSVFPNPTKRNVTVTFDERLFGSSYVIYDQAGKEVLKGKLDHQNLSIDLDELTRGAYLLNINGDFDHSIKLMKL